MKTLRQECDEMCGEYDRRHGAGESAKVCFANGAFSLNEKIAFLKIRMAALPAGTPAPAAAAPSQAMNAAEKYMDLMARGEASEASTFWAAHEADILANANNVRTVSAGSTLPTPPANGASAGTPEGRALHAEYEALMQAGRSSEASEFFAEHQAALTKHMRALEYAQARADAGN